MSMEYDFRKREKQSTADSTDEDLDLRPIESVPVDVIADPNDRLAASRGGGSSAIAAVLIPVHGRPDA